MKTNATNENLSQINQILTKNLPNADFIKRISQLENQINRQAHLMFLDMELFMQNGVEIIQMAKLNNLSLVFINDKKAKPLKQPSVKLRLESGIQFIEHNQIVRLEAQSNYTVFYLKNTVVPIVISKPLKFYADQFDTKQFIRPHRSHLVNKQFVKAYCNENGPHLILKNGQRITIARRKLKGILKTL